MIYETIGEAIAARISELYWALDRLHDPAERRAIVMELIAIYDTIGLR